ncbi:phosphoribosyltransferase family protein [Halalkalibaculum sp. DA384]|uniref:phosphoribosyltransferase family protein n=1 Tax=Halalkalibaculum sp. DA384 TaxID=3373606 RepID=UPI0037549D87
MSDSSELIYMDSDRVGRTLKRMAYQVSEDNRQDRDIFLFGIGSRGFAVASRLNAYLADIYGTEFVLTRLDPQKTLSGKKISPRRLRECYLLVVDDVIFSGHTMFTTLNHIYDFFSFDEIHTAVLVDRGHRRFPIQAQFVGLELSTKLKEHVSVVVQQEKVEKVVLQMG